MKTIFVGSSRRPRWQCNLCGIVSDDTEDILNIEGFIHHNHINNGRVHCYDKKECRRRQRKKQKKEGK